MTDQLVVSVTPKHISSASKVTSSAVSRSTQSTRTFNSQQYLHSKGTTKSHYLIIHSLTCSSFSTFLSLFFVFRFFLCLLLFFLLSQKSLCKPAAFCRSFLPPLREAWHAVFRPSKCMCCLLPLFFIPHKSLLHLLLPLSISSSIMLNVSIRWKSALCHVPRGSVITKTGNLEPSYQPTTTSRTTREVSSLLSKITRTSRKGIHYFLFLFFLCGIRWT